jgi:hypothetical protein
MTLDDLLDTTRAVGTADAETLARGRDAALDAVRRDLAGRARAVRHRARRRMAWGVAVLAVGAVTAWVVLPGGDRGPERTTVSAPPVAEVQFTNASQILDAAATAAVGEPVELGDAPYWKVVSEYSQSGELPDDNGTGQRTIWQGIAGPSVLKDTFGEDIALDAATPLRLPQATLRVGDHTYTWRQANAGALGTRQIRSLLTEGEQDRPSKPGRAPHEWYFFKQAGELLGETPASPAVRRDIWRELATLTGVTTTGRATDAVGRGGWNLTLTVEGYGSQRFIVDPSTGAILQRESALRGTTYRITYLEAGPAETAPTPRSEDETPAGR